MIRNGMTVTVEAEAFEYGTHMGKRARVIKVVRCFAIIAIEGVGVRSVINDPECIQPVMTAESLAARFTGQAEVA